MVHLGSFVCRPAGGCGDGPCRGGWGGEVIALICESPCIHVYQENETLICDYGCNEKDCGRAIASEDLENVDSLIAWQGLVTGLECEKEIFETASFSSAPSWPAPYTWPLNRCHHHCFRFRSLSL